jgi:hypothetical protein
MALTTMSAPQYLPIAPELFRHACDTVTRSVSQLPFLRGGVMITGELVGVTMECLNAEPSRALALSTPHDTPGVAPGLDAYLEERLECPQKTVVPVIAEVLCSAGITEMTEIVDRQMHRPRRAIRLLSPWTWHIASAMAPSVRLGGSAGGGGASLSWLDMCPVCRTGILERVVGKQLFGIPRTDFYIECTHCGAKFIPVGPAFRLVSIATIRDPLWKKHLDKTYPPETWADLARGTGQRSTQHVPTAGKKPAGPGPVLPAASITFSQLKDGSLAVPVLGKTLYFRPVKLQYTGGAKEDTFTRVTRTLEELLMQPAFVHLQSPVNARYSRYLSLKAGLFLGQLRERHDPFYREFLHAYGDEKFGTFRTGDPADEEKRGVLIVAVNRGLYLAWNAADPLRTVVNNRFGRIGPDDCLLSGDPARCRVNALLCNNRKEAGLYLYPAEADEERRALTDALCGLLSAG